jgi:alkylated DNA repair dioxygenase AlkB
MTTATWLVRDPVVERVELDPGSWVDVVRGLVPDADAVHDELLTTMHWEQNKVFRYERWVDEPRLFAVQKGAERHAALQEAQRWLMRRYRIPLPDVAPLLLYRNERDSVAFHRDRELRWLEDTIIGVLTLGATRPWLVKPLGPRRFGEDDDMVGAIDLAPASGDLLVMGGRCQAAWLHAVPKVQGRCRSRTSVQWRWTSRRGRRDPNPSYYAPRHFGRP